MLLALAIVVFVLSIIFGWIGWLSAAMSDAPEQHLVWWPFLIGPGISAALFAAWYYSG